MRKLTIALIGVFVGQLLMLPSLYRIYITPAIVSEFVDVRDGWWNNTKPSIVILKDVPSVFFKEKKDLIIHIRSRQEVIAAYKEAYGKDNPDLLGFYNPKPKNKNIHEIYSVNSVGIVLHEIRHVSEGHFHRPVLNATATKQWCEFNSSATTLFK